MENDGRFAVEPGQTYRLEGSVRSTGHTRAHTDVAYFKDADPQPSRVDRNVTFPYEFSPQEGETHAVPIFTVGDIPAESLYID